MREYTKRSIFKISALAVFAAGVAVGITGMAKSAVENFSLPSDKMYEIINLLGAAASSAVLPYPIGGEAADQPTKENAESVAVSDPASESSGFAEESAEISDNELDDDNGSSTDQENESGGNSKSDEEEMTELPVQESAAGLLLSMNISNTVESYEGLYTEKSGGILEVTYGKLSGDMMTDLENGQIRNCTDLSNEDISEITAQLPDIHISDDGPQVLIMHTHTTESYEPDDDGYYDLAFTGRSLDPRNSVVGVGAEIAKGISDSGISVIHDGTVYDDPLYSYSYSRSAKRVKEILEMYPSIKVVLDIHRDGIEDGDYRIAPITEIDGKKAAQIMIICGCDDGSGILPDYTENLKFAAYLQNEIERKYPTITRPLLFDYRFYNQDLTTGSLLIEVGALGNTVEQARYTGQLLGTAIGESLCKLG